jgi:hypothetical protein
MSTLATPPARLRSLAVLALAALSLSAQEQGIEGSQRYARVVDSGATIRNLADPKGTEVLKAPAGMLLAVHREDRGWLEVEVPGGYPVWVYGRYLQPTDEDDVLELSRNGVNMRPEPRSDVTNFPLPQRLQAGDRVRAFELLDPDAELEQNWVHIWSPPGVRAYVRASEATPLAEGEDGAELWAAAVRERASQPAPRTSPRKPATQPGERAAAGEPAAPKGADPAAQKANVEAERALAEARTAIERETEKEAPDYAEARRALERVIAMAPTGATAAQARLELENVQRLEEVAVLRADLARLREQRLAELDQRQRVIEARSRAKDPLGESFLARGILVREAGPGGEPRFVLHFGGQATAAIACSSGRYDLDLFTGFEIGVGGEEQGAAPGLPAGASRVDVARIEILQRR